MSEKNSGGVHRVGKFRLNESEETVKKKKNNINYNKLYSILVSTSIVIHGQS